ncbi:MAG: hypothetical protein EOL97_15580 [Spirochaetia bacterium]|nr:hypothetical protein [Spirochaetia bacterium]
MYDDFVSVEDVNLNIEGYNEGEWKYKPISGGDELDWAKEYIFIKDGKSYQDLGKLTKLKFGNITKVPYTKEQLGKDWNEMSKEERISCICKLKSSVMDKLIVAIDKIDNYSIKKV